LYEQALRNQDPSIQDLYWPRY